MNDATDTRRRVRSAAWLWSGVAAAFYVTFIALTVYRSRH